MPILKTALPPESSASEARAPLLGPRQQEIDFACASPEAFEGSINGDLLLGVAWPKLAEEWRKTKCSAKSIWCQWAAKQPTMVTIARPTVQQTSPNPCATILCHLHFTKKLRILLLRENSVDMTPSDARFGWACLRTRTGYVGICFIARRARVAWRIACWSC